jgi:hypothetical protein
MLSNRAKGFRKMGDGEGNAVAPLPARLQSLNSPEPDHWEKRARSSRGDPQGLKKFVPFPRQF